MFREKHYDRGKGELAGWLSLLTTEDVGDARRLAEEYPWLAGIYQEMGEYIHKPEEVLNMFSEALRILDRNTVLYMIEQQQERIRQLQEEIEQQQERIGQLQEEIGQQQEEIGQLQEEIGQLQEEKEQQERIGQLQEQIAQMREALRQAPMA